MNIDNYYWTFSAAAQGIAALFGFLLAGVALAFQMIDRVVERDPTLFDVSESLKRKYHSRMAKLAFVTGVAILGSLFATWLNPHPGLLRTIVMTVSALSSIAAIVWAIIFVVQIVSPSRFAQQAEEDINEMVKHSPFAEPTIHADSFVSEFIALEKDMRDWLLRTDPTVVNRVDYRTALSFRQMVEYLYQREMITPSLRDDFLAVNKYRNLLIHGHTNLVPDDIINKLKAAKANWKNMKK